LFESGDFSLFQKQKSDELSVAAEKVLPLVLFVAFEIICDSAGWMRAENTLYTDGRMRLSESGRGDFGRLWSRI